MTSILVATSEGVHDLGDGSVAWPGADVTCLRVARGERWAVLDGQEVVRSHPVRGATTWAVDTAAVRCLAVARDGAYVGTAGARLVRLHPDGGLEPVGSFDEVEGREDWYTPWGGPPDVRSVAVTNVGDLLVNIHVGGILRMQAPAAGQPDLWVTTIDIHADVHEVACGPGPVALAAAAVGLCVSVDDGKSWFIETAGLHATYARAVCIAIDQIILSVSDGPSGTRAALYRRQAGGTETLHKCEGGLPEWIDGNVDTCWLAAHGRHVAFATERGDIWASEDTGSTWRMAASSLPEPRAVVFA